MPHEMMEAQGKAAKQSQVHEEIARLEKVSIILNESLGELHDKLQPIMRSPEVLEDKEATDRPDAVLVPIADQVRSIRRKLENSHSFVQEMKDRIEV